MTSKCKNCGIEIEWREVDGRNVPYTMGGARHSYKECPKAPESPQKSQKRPTITTRWEGIKQTRVIIEDAEEQRMVNEAIASGWVVLDTHPLQRFKAIKKYAGSTQETEELVQWDYIAFVLGLRN